MLKTSRSPTGSGIWATRTLRKVKLKGRKSLRHKSWPKEADVKDQNQTIYISKHVSSYGLTNRTQVQRNYHKRRPVGSMQARWIHDGAFMWPNVDARLPAGPVYTSSWQTHVLTRKMWDSVSHILSLCSRDGNRQLSRPIRDAKVFFNLIWTWDKIVLVWFPSQMPRVVSHSFSLETCRQPKHQNHLPQIFTWTESDQPRTFLRAGHDSQ